MLYADCDGIPVTLVMRPALDCRAWDVPGGRLFDPGSFARNGVPVDEATFRTLARSFVKKLH